MEFSSGPPTLWAGAVVEGPEYQCRPQQLMRRRLTQRLDADGGNR